MKTNNNPANIENINARNSEQVNNSSTRKGEKLEDFGQKIGGARKDLYQAATVTTPTKYRVQTKSLTIKLYKLWLHKNFGIAKLTA